MENNDICLQNAMFVASESYSLTLYPMPYYDQTPIIGDTNARYR